MSKNAKRGKIGLVIAAAVGVAFVAMYFAPLQKEITIIPTTAEDQEMYDALGVAQRYVPTSPTFAFDGNINTLRTEHIGTTKSIPAQYLFRATFDSNHGGFGNREGQPLTQAITPHTMEIIVSEGAVISAITDGAWDELNRQYVLSESEEKAPLHDKPAVSFEGNVEDHDTFVRAVEAQGTSVETIEKREDSVFSVPVTVIAIGGADVQVFEFKSASDAQSAALTVSDDGTEIGTSIIRWIDAPHFYTKGKVIVLYVGQNPDILNLLGSILGPQFAGM